MFGEVALARPPIFNARRGGNLFRRLAMTVPDTDLRQVRDSESFTAYAQAKVGFLEKEKTLVQPV